MTTHHLLSSVEQAAFVELLDAWNGREELRTSGASFVQRLEASREFEQARHRFHRARRFAHAA